jgi:hypothetical protein
VTLYECEIRHARSAPVRNVFRYRGYLWLVDVDHLPHIPLLTVYDVPSAFYQLILDPSMAYSCAYWDGQQDLNGAQRAKLDLIMSKLALQPGQALLDVGCGWGSLTLHAARARVQVTGVTLSREQGGFVRQRARGLGLGGRATRARSWTAGCGATPGTRTTSATSACGGGCSASA